MSDRWVPRRDSRWSSERDRARRAQGDATSGAEQPKADEAPQTASFVPRRPARSATPPPDPATERTPSTERIDRLMASPSPRRPADGGGGDQPPTGNLPDLPGSGGSRGRVGTRVIVLGALLFLAMASIALLPRILDDDDGSADPTPTPELIQTPTPRPEGEAAVPTDPAQDAEHIVCVDAGHGGWDAGRTREANARAPAMLEKEITLAMAWMLKERLENEGIGVVLTRPSGLAVNVFNQDVNGDGQTLQDSQQAGDRDELQARINICNDAQADVLISLHLNGFDDPTARGYEVIYTPEPFREFGARNADLATYVYREIGAAYDEVGFETEPRGTLPDTELEATMHEMGAERNLIMTGPAIENADFTLVPSAMPGIVIEPVFITNDDDAAFIAEPANQRLLVDAYADGILTYLEQYPEPPA